MVLFRDFETLTHFLRRSYLLANFRGTRTKTRKGLQAHMASSASEARVRNDFRNSSGWPTNRPFSVKQLIVAAAPPSRSSSRRMTESTGRPFQTKSPCDETGSFLGVVLKLESV